MITGDSEMPNSFSELVDRWRGAAPTLRDDLALQRIEQANPHTKRPILLLGLDGVDEMHVSSAFRDAAGRIIDFFWNLHQQFKNSKDPPPICLVVSCRRQQDVDKYIQTVTGLGVAGKPPKYLPFERFSLSEIQTLLRQTGAVSPPVVEKLIRATDPDLNQEYPEDSLACDQRAVTSLSLIRHPILWRCFVSLTPANQSALVDGDLGAQDALAAHYLQWFSQRAQQRLNLSQSDAEIALCAVAQKCISGETNYRFDFWEDAIIGTSCCSKSDARNLYREGLSAGFIEDLPPSGGQQALFQQLWVWRYTFLWSHLRRRTIGWTP
jgi:hypothetical protein